MIENGFEATASYGAGDTITYIRPRTRFEIWWERIKRLRWNVSTVVSEEWKCTAVYSAAKPDKA